MLINWLNNILYTIYMYTEMSGWIGANFGALKNTLICGVFIYSTRSIKSNQMEWNNVNSTHERV